LRRRNFITFLAGAAFAGPLSINAQQTAIPVIGYLSQGSPESDTVRIASLRRGLSEAGYVEGQNVTVEYRWADNQLDRLPALAAGLVQRRVAVITTPGHSPTFAAKGVTSTIPIVFVVGVDPVQLGLVESLHRPGRNLTGIGVFRPELEAKRLEVLHELLPDIASVGLLEDPERPDGNDHNERRARGGAWHRDGNSNIARFY
jgi:putative ABC transport system substrate-binding protein